MLSVPMTMKWKLPVYWLLLYRSATSLGARPGARREIVEAYIKRLNDLEQLERHSASYQDLCYPGWTRVARM